MEAIERWAIAEETFRSALSECGVEKMPSEKDERTFAYIRCAGLREAFEEYLEACHALLPRH